MCSAVWSLEELQNDNLISSAHTNTLTLSTVTSVLVILSMKINSRRGTETEPWRTAYVA